MIHSTILLRQLRKDIGYNIHRMRVERQLPLYKLSAQTGVPQKDLDYYELGKGQIGIDHIVKIACALHCSVLELVVF